MPCCIARLDYRGCLHTTWIKLGCSVNCRTGCRPASKRLVALHAEYLWACYDCRLAARQEEEALRVEEYMDYLTRLQGCAGFTDAWREGRTACVRYQAAREKQLGDRREAAVSQEVTGVTRWVCRYGVALAQRVLADAANKEKARVFWTDKANKMLKSKSWDVLIKANVLNSQDELRAMQPLPGCVVREVKKRRLAATAGRCKRIKLPKERQTRKLPAVPLFDEAAEQCVRAQQPAWDVNPVVSKDSDSGIDPDSESDVASDIAEFDSDEDMEDNFEASGATMYLDMEQELLLDKHENGRVGQLPFKDLTLEDNADENPLPEDPLSEDLLSDMDPMPFEDLRNSPSPSPSLSPSPSP